MKPAPKIIRSFVIIFLLITLTAPAFAPANVQSVSRISPLITRLAAEVPNRPLRLIVQKGDTTNRAEKLSTQLGGKIIKDLHIINAFAVELPAGAVSQLGGSSSVKWVSLDAAVTQSDDSTPSTALTDGTVPPVSVDDGVPTSNSNPVNGVPTSSSTSGMTATSLNSFTGILTLNAYQYDIKATKLKAETRGQLMGQGITVAVVDSGIMANDPDLADANGNSRVIASQNFAEGETDTNDYYGHGTHVAGIIGGNGSRLRGIFAGIAPQVNFVDVKVTDKDGKGTESDVISGLQWIYDNKDLYHIQVVNLSLNSSSPQPYQTSPLDAALEVLWFNKILVVVSAGNNGAGQNNGILYPPANDPFVITVGAVNDKGTVNTRDDILASFSAYGTTESGFNKPDLVAPGVNIISLLARPDAILAQEHPSHIITSNYFRMSGTSMASAVTSGAIALLVESNPDLNPDQVKYRLISTAHPFGTGAGAGYLDIYVAVHSLSLDSANTGIPISQLLVLDQNVDVSGSVMWNSVMWNSVMWNSVMWNSVMWNSVMWNSDYWGD